MQKIYTEEELNEVLYTTEDGTQVTWREHLEITQMLVNIGLDDRGEPWMRVDALGIEDKEAIKEFKANDDKSFEDKYGNYPR